MTDIKRTGSTRAAKPAALDHGRRNRAFIAIGATCALAGIAAVGLLQPAGTASIADAAEAPSLAEITTSQSQSFEANLVTAADDAPGFGREEAVQAELEPEPEPTQTPEETADSAEPSDDSGSDESGSSNDSGGSNYPQGGTYTGESPQAIAQQMLADRGMGDQWGCFEAIIGQESGWDPYATNPSSGAYGIPQSLPGSKMASHGSDWATNPATQIAWAIDYMKNRYGSPCGAYDFKFTQGNGWY